MISILDKQQRETAKKLTRQFEYNPQAIEGLTQEELFLISLHVLEKSIDSRTPADINILSKGTEQIKFFRELRQSSDGGPLIHEQCCKHMYYKFYKADTVLFKEGERGSTFWIILQGKVKVSKKEYVEPTEEELKSGQPIEYYINIELIRLGTGSCFGELALKNDDKRQATVSTLEDTHFAVLDKEPFQLILKDIDQKVAYLQAFASMKIFQNWQYNIVKNLYDLSSEKQYAINNVIYREGELAENMYFIKSGEFAQKIGIVDESNTLLDEHINNQINDNKLRQQKPKKLKYVTHKILSKGECFGEEELFGQSLSDKKERLNANLPQYRKTTVICISPNAEVYIIHKKDIVRRIMMKPEYWNQIVESNIMKGQMRQQFIDLQDNNKPAEVIQNTVKVVRNFDLYDKPKIYYQIPKLFPISEENKPISNKDMNNNLTIQEVYKESIQKQLQDRKAYLIEKNKNDSNQNILMQEAASKYGQKKKRQLNKLELEDFVQERFLQKFDIPKEFIKRSIRKPSTSDNQEHYNDNAFSNQKTFLFKQNDKLSFMKSVSRSLHSSEQMKSDCSLLSIQTSKQQDLLSKQQQETQQPQQQRNKVSLFNNQILQNAQSQSEYQLDVPLTVKTEIIKFPGKIKEQKIIKGLSSSQQNFKHYKSKTLIELQNMQNKNNNSNNQMKLNSTRSTSLYKSSNQYDYLDHFISENNNKQQINQDQLNAINNFFQNQFTLKHQQDEITQQSSYLPLKYNLKNILQEKQKIRSFSLSKYKQPIQLMQKQFTQTIMSSRNSSRVLLKDSIYAKKKTFN